MGLLSGSLSITRLRVVSRPAELAFGDAGFHEIDPGSELRESVGFVPFEPEAEYQIGHDTFGFRVRIDRVKPDATAVRERLGSLVRAELEATGVERVAGSRRRELRALAEEELRLRTAPTTRIVECCLDGASLWIGTTSNARLGIVLEQLRRIQVLADYTAPWIEAGEPAIEDSVVDASAPGQSVRGCRFLRALLGDPEIAVEPESGSVGLRTADATVRLEGRVLPDLHRYVERGAEVLDARLVTRDARFRFDALNYRLSAVSLEATARGHWSEVLEVRVAAAAGLFQLLDQRYMDLARAGRF